MSFAITSRFPNAHSKIEFTFLEDLIIQYGTQLFPGFEVKQSMLFNVIRDADFAVDEDEQPVFIEMNLKYGAMEYHQLMNGPLFGKMTDRVLDEIYGKKD